jgi:outer membrane protein OmpA-like peptidoglycan-associated protein
VDHRIRARCRSAALRIGILALLSATAMSGAALAGGMPAAANALTNNAGRAKATPASVSVDYSALDTVAPGLLIPAAPRADAPIILHPPAGTAPIRLRPPPGVKSIVRQARPAAPKEAPKAATPPETKTAALTPERTVPSTTPAKPAPAAKAAPAAAAPKPAITPPAAAPKQAAAPAPAAAPANTMSASAQQPRSLLTPPPPPAQAAAATPAAAAPTAAPAAAQTKAEETKVASLPPAPAKTAEPDTLRIPFGVGGADLPADAAANVKALAQRLAKDPALRVQLVAYASDPEKSISRSRRLSLERAVAVRKVLLAAGVESTRIDLRALGEQSGGGPPDRVDAITTRR